VKLKQKVTELQRQMFVGSLFVITGTGHHSYDHNKKANAKEGKLGPVIQTMLRDMGFAVTDASTDRRGGMLAVAFF